MSPRPAREFAVPAREIALPAGEFPVPARVFERHCAAESAKDVEGIMATLDDDIEHDLVGDAVLHDRTAIAARYKGLFDVLAEDSMTSLHRYHGAAYRATADR
jgi:hypothetical protein